MKLEDFLKNFPSVDETLKADMTAGLMKLNAGAYFRNDDKFRLEYLQFDDYQSNKNQGNPIAWIDYIALSKNPVETFKVFNRNLRRKL